jgi:hypothetical protein
MFGENFDDTGAGSRTRRESGYPFWGISTQSVEMRRIDLSLSSRICPLCPLHLTPSNATYERWAFASENQPPITLMVAHASDE